MVSPRDDAHPPVTVTAHLSDQDAAAVTDLVRAAEDADRVAPLSESALLSLRASPPGVRHLITRDGTRDDDSRVVGYGVVQVPAARDLPATEPPSGELVVHPAFRRRDHGRRLLREMQDQACLLTDHLGRDAGAVRVWAHGNLPGAQGLAAAEGYEPVRELWQMSRVLDEELPTAHLPDGFSLRAYRPGSDDPAWLAVNSAAFAHHPEQGAWTQDDLDLRFAEPWFDPAGFLVLQDDGAVSKDSAISGGGVMAGYHWTKVHPPGPSTDGAGDDGAVGEVYVVGIDPAYQGRGLSVPLVLAGLEHLRRIGLARVMLYVDADNAPAVRVYSRLGFSRAAVDVMFARTRRAGRVTPSGP